MTGLVLYFEDEQACAMRFAKAAQLPAQPIARHRFPDGELKLTLPTPLPARVVLYRSLGDPNEKLMELMFVAQTARQLGAQSITLVCPYLAYMRQDIAFHPGEVVSQRVLGQFLAKLFDSVITVDPHLHRVATLQEAVPVARPVVVSGAPLLGDYVATHVHNAFLLGPDGESAQWVAQAARAHGLDHAACQKVRHGDTSVDIQLPDVNLAQRHVVLVDDVASSGRTLARAAQLARAAGALSVDVAVTHALFAQDALEVIHDAGVRHIWSTDCLPHASNVIEIADTLAQAYLS
jgi:ribose-phosphate pyrophosphokinase